MKKVIIYIGLALLAFVIWATLRTPSPEEVAKSNARAAVELCWQEQGRRSNSAQQAQFIAGACEMMQQKIDSNNFSIPAKTPTSVGRWESERIEAEAKAKREADPVFQKAEAANLEQAKSECKLVVDQNKKTYKQLFAAEKYWDASTSLRQCANAFQDPVLIQMVKDAERRSYIQDIKSAKLTKEQKQQALEFLQRDFPEQAKQFASQIK